MRKVLCALGWHTWKWGEEFLVSPVYKKQRRCCECCGKIEERYI